MNIEKQPLIKKDASPRKCLIYTRVSTESQDTQNQITLLKEYADKQDWQIIEIIQDVSSGSKSANERQGLKRAFELGHKKQYDILLFYSLDRFSREGSRATIQYLTQLESYGIDWHSFTEPYISSLGLFKDCIVSLLSTLANIERIKISDRTKAGIQRIRKERPYLRLGRKPTDPKRIEQAKELRTQGLKYKDIAKTMGVTVGRAHQMVGMA